MKSASFVLIAIVTVSSAIAAAGSLENFEKAGYVGGVCIITDRDAGTLREVRRILMREGARGTHVLPPDVVITHFPPDFDQSALGGLPVRIVRSAMEIMPGEIDAGNLALVRDMLRADELSRTFALEAAGVEFDRDDFVLKRVPPEVIDRYEVKGPRQGSPQEILARNPQQNSEFLIGSVIANVIFIDGISGLEDWTEEEIQNVKRDVLLGVSHYENAANWVPLEFQYNWIGPVYVTHDPIELPDGIDQYWVLQAMEGLGIRPGETVFDQVHNLNDSMRVEAGTDWAFTAFIVDASENGCWTQRNYTAYAFLGGPYLVNPYPACGYGAALGFGKVFIHEMSHVFWATDEYVGGGSCGDVSGYLNYENWNQLTILFGGEEVPCDPSGTIPCIMHRGYIQNPLPICFYTMGQVGLADDIPGPDGNSVPDLYEITPEVTFFRLPGAGTDTIMSDNYMMSCRVECDAVPNQNPAQGALDRIDYAPWLVEGLYRIGDSPWHDVEPMDGKWDESKEMITKILPGFTPGINELRVRAESFVGLRGEGMTEVVYVGLRYALITAQPMGGLIELHWATTGEIFDGTTFRVYRRDLTDNPADSILVAEFDGDEGIGTETTHFRYYDEDIEPRHVYSYHVRGDFDFLFRDKLYEYDVRSADARITAGIPLGSEIVSYILPNPAREQAFFTVNVPKSFYDPSGGQDPAAAYYSGASVLQEVMTPVDIAIYNVAGQRIKTIYNRLRYGGYLNRYWDLTDNNGVRVPPGVYFLRVAAGGDRSTKKIVVLR